jgi:UrcA family protein
MSRKILFATLAATAALSLCTAASAGPQAQPYDPDTVSVKVSLADLNLNNEPGARIALRRIRNAAREVCGVAPSHPLMKESELYWACQRGATDRAVARLDVPTVSALNAAQTRIQVAGR